MLRSPRNILGFTSNEVGAKVKYMPNDFEMTNSHGQKIQPTIVHINLCIHETSLEKNLKFKGVKKIQLQRQIIIWNKITTSAIKKYNFQKKLHNSPMEKMTSKMFFFAKLLHIKRLTYNESPHT